MYTAGCYRYRGVSAECPIHQSTLQRVLLNPSDPRGFQRRHRFSLAYATLPNMSTEGGRVTRRSAAAAANGEAPAPSPSLAASVRKSLRLAGKTPGGADALDDADANGAALQGTKTPRTRSAAAATAATPAPLKTPRGSASQIQMEPDPAVIEQVGGIIVNIAATPSRAKAVETWATGACYSQATFAAFLSRLACSLCITELYSMPYTLFLQL